MWSKPARCVAWMVVSVAFALLQIAARAADAPAAAAAADVPVKQVVLFSSGVGYFEHFGSVKGNGSTELRFQTEQINDVLKSLVLQDLDGGTAGTVSYPSLEPIERTLKSFQVDITSNPALEDLLNQLRGAALTVSTTEAKLSGTIVGLQKRQRGGTEKQPPEEYWVLNLKTGRTIRPIAMSDVRDLSLEDPKLDAELDRALAAVAQSRGQDKKPVTINFRGEGERRVRIGYVVETPIWKTSYRLILGDAGAKQLEKKDAKSSKLQGWAIVENQTDSDWNDVQLSLVSGRPISFIQQLYLPLYVPRPVVWPQLYASLRPQTYKGGISSEDMKKLKAIREQAEGEAPAEAPNFSLDQASGQASEGRGGGGGLFGGSGGGGRPTTQPSMDAAASVISMASAGQLGELFEYTVGNVSLPRQRSAMIPVVTDDIDVERVSIYNADVLAEHPLTGARIKNTTGKHLLQGPVTVLDAGAYAGDASINDVPPGQQRLVSYGIDLQVTVAETGAPSTTTIQTAKIIKGVLQVQQKVVDTSTFTAQNNAKVDKTIVFEVPNRGGGGDNYKIVEPATVDETTAEVLRFSRSVAAGRAVSLKVKSEAIGYQGIQLASAQSEQLGVFVRATQIPAGVREALTKAIQMQEGVASLASEIAQRKAKIGAMTQEQERIRENMKSVSEKSEYYQRLLKKLDDQETSLETLQREIAARESKLAEQREQLKNYLANLNVG